MKLTKEAKKLSYCDQCIWSCGSEVLKSFHEGIYNDCDEFESPGAHASHVSIYKPRPSFNSVQRLKL